MKNTSLTALTNALNTHKGSADHDSRYFLKSGGTITGQTTIKAGLVTHSVCGDKNAAYDLGGPNLYYNYVWARYHTSNIVTGPQFGGSGQYCIFGPGIDTPSKSVVLQNTGCMRPFYDGDLDLGTSSFRWGQIYSVAGSISTSDREKKQDITPINEDYIKSFLMGLNPVSYKFKDGTSGRTHYGLIAQDIEDLLQAIGSTSLDFAGFIKSPKQRQTIKARENKLTFQEIPEYDYGLRYEEFIAPIIKMLQDHERRLQDIEQSGK